MAEGSYNASLHPKMEEHVPWPFQFYVGVMIYFFLLILGKYVRQYNVMNVVVVVGRHGLHLEYLNFFYSRVMNTQTNSSFLDCISILFRFFPLLLIYNRTHFGKKKQWVTWTKLMMFVDTNVQIMQSNSIENFLNNQHMGNIGLKCIMWFSITIDSYLSGPLINVPIYDYLKNLIGLWR